MVCFGRDIKDHLVQPCCHGQGHHPLHQAAKSPHLQRAPASWPATSSSQLSPEITHRLEVRRCCGRSGYRRDPAQGLGSKPAARQHGQGCPWGFFSAPTAELSSASSSQNTLVKTPHRELCNPHKDAEKVVNLNRQV